MVISTSNDEQSIHISTLVTPIEGGELCLATVRATEAYGWFGVKPQKKLKGS